MVVPEEVQLEGWLAVILLPFCVADLRSRVSPMLVASDASEIGMGVCRTSTISPEGLHALHTLVNARPVHSSKVGLIEMFAGIGGLRQGLANIGIRPDIHVAFECDPAAVKVFQSAWPSAWLLPDVTQITPSLLQTYLEKSPHVELWIVGGGFPCQPYSRLNANRRGMADPRALHHWIPRVTE